MGLNSFLNPLKQARESGKLTKLSEVLSTNVSGSLGFSKSVGLPIGVDFGTGSLKLLQLNGGNPPSLLAAACLESPPELLTDHKRRLEYQFEGLTKMVKRVGFKGRRAVCAIPAWQTTCKHIQFPRQDGVAISQLVEAAIPQQMGVDPATLVYRFVEVSNVERNGNKIDVVLIAVQRAIVDMLMRAMVDAKLEPVGLHSEFMCTLRAFDHVTRRESDTDLNRLYLDIGATTTKVLISHGSNLVFARMINVGGHDLDRAIAKSLNLDPAHARIMRLALDARAEAVLAPPVQDAAPTSPVQQGAAPSEPAAWDGQNERRTGEAPAGFTGNIMDMPSAHVAPAGVCVAEPLEIITDEVRMCVRYHATQFPGKRIDKIVFVGGESRHRGLTQHIARTLRLPGQIADPLAWIARKGDEPTAGVNFKEAQPGWAVALGLCLAPTDL